MYFGSVLWGIFLVLAKVHGVGEGNAFREFKCLVVLGDLVDEVLKDKAVLPLRDISSLSYFDMGNSSRRIRNGDWLLVIFK